MTWQFIGPLYHSAHNIVIVFVGVVAQSLYDFSAIAPRTYVGNSGSVHQLKNIGGNRLPSHLVFEVMLRYPIIYISFDMIGTSQG